MIISIRPLNSSTSKQDGDDDVKDRESPMEFTGSGSHVKTFLTLIATESEGCHATVE